MIDIISFFRMKTNAKGSPKANDQLRAKLAYYGDAGVAKRHVAHYAYPLEGSDNRLIRPIADALQARGFSVNKASLGGLAIEHLSDVASEEFDMLTAELSGWFAAKQWEYDGWECAIIYVERKQAC